MNKQAKRQFFDFGIFLLLCAAVILLNAIWSSRLSHTPVLNGWVLLAMILSLAAYQVRKQIQTLPFLSLGSLSTWFRIHKYTGLLSCLVFGLHINFRIPNGTFECLLAGLYLGVFFSGVAGLLLTRLIPPRLASTGAKVLFERIPQQVQQLGEEVENIVFENMPRSESTIIPEIYANQLRSFFRKPRSILLHLLQSGRPPQLLLVQLRGQQRALSANEQAVMQEITNRVTIKNDLDYQFTLQGMLRVWLFVHVPLTYALLVFSIFHAVLAGAFTGGN